MLGLSGGSNFPRAVDEVRHLVRSKFFLIIIYFFSFSPSSLPWENSAGWEPGRGKIKVFSIRQLLEDLQRRGRHHMETVRSSKNEG